MRSSRTSFFVLFAFVVSLLMTTPMAMHAEAKPASISGAVADSTGALIPGAAVTVTGADGNEQTVTSDGLGHFIFLNLAPGPYVLRASAPGFSAVSGMAVNATAGHTTTLNITLVPAVVEQQVEVLAEAVVDIEPANNASAMTISGSALQTMSDDQDDLAQDLALLAGPSAGPEGGQIYVDGFSDAKLPPKSAIREIRINQNPFSAEYDRLGYGRVEILTKPGADKLHGEARFNFGDSVLNARNPFAPTKPDYQRRTFEGTLGGPMGKNASYTFQVERRDIGQAALINALWLDSDLNTVPYRQSILDPHINTEISGRLDYQLSLNHTLIGRYEWEKDYQTNDGLDSFSMPSRAYNSDQREHVLQMTETAILNPRTVNEVKFQYRRSHDAYDSTNSEVAIEVPEAFVSGGTSMSLNGLLENRYELNEMLSLSVRKHTLKFGGRFRAIQEDNASADDYNGVFTFDSLTSYRITEEGVNAGLSPDQIRANGGGASQFSISSGEPMARVTQFDVGLFAQDDWRIGNSLTLSGGLRFEKQTNINDWSSWAPRVGLAWAIPSRTSNRPFAVLRVGFGAFYNRIRESLVLDSRRLDGVHQQKYLIPNPDFYPLVPSAETLSAYAQDQAIRKLAPDLRAPYTQQLALSLEKQLQKNTTASVSYMRSRGFDMLRSININAPWDATGGRPFPGGNIYEYNSTGRFLQHQVIANVNARISRRYNLFGYYTYSSAHSDTDGAMSFPSYTYDLTSEYARAGFDVRHRAMMGGSLTAPLGLQFSPFVVMHSGDPFNIIVGKDLNGDSIFNDRPAWATDMSRPSVVHTRWGTFDSQPVAGQSIIPRNLGNSPGMIAFNLRLSKAFGFGEHTGSARDSSPAGAASLGGPGGPGGGPGGPGRFRLPEAMAEGRKYSLTLSVSARNLFNIVNLGMPVGNLSSQLFGTSTTIHGFGPGSASANRMIDLQMRFSF